MERLIRLEKDDQNPIFITTVLHHIFQSNQIDDWAYSFEGYEDERQCIERDKIGWKVYFGERGKEKRCKSFKTQIEAGEELIRRLGQDENQRKKMLSEFKKAVVTPQKTGAGSYVAYVSLSNNVAKKTIQIRRTKKDLTSIKAPAIAACKLTADSVKVSTVKGRFSKGITTPQKGKYQKNSIREKMQG